MKLVCITCRIVSFAGLASAWTYNASVGRGPPDAYSAAAINRNDTSSRTFDLLYNNGAEPSTARELDWSWTINITEVEVTDAGPANSDPRILNTIYSFSWPDVREPADNLRDQLAQYENGTNILPESRYVDASSYCVTVVESSFPANITNAYEESSSLCTIPVQCANALQREWWNTNERDEQGCRGANVDATKIEDYEGTFGAWNVTMLNIAAPNNGTVANGTAFYHRSTPAYDGNNSTDYDEERLRMHMLIIDSGTEFYLRCQRIDATPLQNDESIGAAVPGSASSLNASLTITGLAITATLFYLL